MRFSLISISFFIIIFFISNSFFIVKADCPHAVPERYKHLKPGRVVAAYLASWDKYGSYSVDQLETIAPYLTHIVYAFAQPEISSGLCTLHDSWADVGSNFEHRKKVGGFFGRLYAIKKKHPHLKILLSIGGGGAYSKALSEIGKQENWSSFVRSVDQLLDGYCYDYVHSKTGEQKKHYFSYKGLFDGVDLDWEFETVDATVQARQSYIDLVRSLKAMLEVKTETEKRPFLLTAALQVQAGIMSAMPIVEVAPFLDWFNLMAYDYANLNAQTVSLNAPICNLWSNNSIDSSLQKMYAMDISPEKIVLGIALYGYGFDQVPEKLGVPFEKTERTKTYRYETIEKMLKEDSACIKKWNKRGRVPYVYCADPSTKKGLLVTYDDFDSIREKIKFAKNQCSQGVIFWRLSGDDIDHGLLKSIIDLP